MFPITAHTINVTLSFVISSGILLVLCFLSLGMRFYARMRPAITLGYDDLFLVLGFVRMLYHWQS
jgi:hypothetical protein